MPGLHSVAHENVVDFCSQPEFVEAGVLVGYGTDTNATTREIGIYVGRILKGERAGDLPVVQATKFELVLNLKTARTLGLQFPTQILALADAVIE